MTTWTSPRTWVGGETPDQTTFNTHVRDNLNHLYENKPYTLIPGLEGSADVAGLGGAGTSEEWSTSTTGLTWSPSSPTTVDSDTTIPSFLYISNQADATERLGTKSWSPGSGAFDARLGNVMIASNSSAANVTSFFGLHIGDATNAARLALLVSYNYSTAVTSIVAYTYSASTPTQRGSTYTTPPGAPVYLRIARDGSNNCTFYWSTTGVLWQAIATQAHTLTVTNIGVRASGNVTASFQASADWLRTSV